MGMDDHNAIDLRENALFLPASRSLAARAAVSENHRSAPAFTPQRAGVHIAACRRSHRSVPAFTSQRAGVQVNLQDEMWSQILAKLA